METRKAELRIYGMTCDDCVATVSRGLRDQNGVLDVTVSLNDGTGEVTIDSEKLRPEDLLKSRVFSKPSHYRATLMDQ
ncbi:MAG: heavy-metal-associated domain-containing protein [Thermoplasmatales archaeon]|jgi:copper chaperone CopZ|nr:heavy-metal-associated domain-containing protein [Candidatus Thermoplasmatota archaeon]MDA8056065.1 heavy-metal-associated domain-containing protein [Thermoplasmatales archaeon]